MSRNKKKVRNYLLPKEFDRLLVAAKDSGRHAHRNYTLILLCYRHGLRLGELMNLRWRMVDLKSKVLRVSRRRGGINSVHPLRTIELQALRTLKKDYPKSSYLFTKDRGALLSERSVSRIVSEAAVEAGIKIPVNPSTLRRGCSYALANSDHNILAIQNYLGHKNIQQTLRYMQLSSKPFKNFWRD
jgi:integrase